VWTNENRGRYERSGLRYPSDLTNEEWALVEPLITSSISADSRALKLNGAFFQIWDDSSTTRTPNSLNCDNRC
jgi:hypothetical protein